MSLITIGAIAGILAVIILLIAVAASRYKKCAPEEAMILTGRGGQRIVIGGGVFVMPVVQQLWKLSLAAHTIQVDRKGIYTKNRIPITVNAVLSYKVKGEDEAIKLAAQAFHGKSPQEIAEMIERISEGAFRDICGTMTPEEINENRDKFQQEVTKSAQDHLNKVGIDLISFNVAHISDDIGYFTNLGAPASAEVDKEARVKKAEANRSAVVVEAEQKLAGEKRQAETQAEIAEANKDRDVKKAKYNGEVAVENAKADQAGPKAKAEAEKEVVEKQKDVAEARAELTEQELLTTKVRPAEAAKEATIAEAEGEKQAAILKGQGEGEAAQARGEGEAAGIKAGLFAEADGLERKAKALKEFNEAGMGLQVAMAMIEKLPEIIKAAASPIAAIDKMQIIDFGGNGAGSENGGGPVAKLLNIPPEVLAKTDASMKATIGVGLTDFIQLVRKGGITGALAGPEDDKTAKPTDKTAGIELGK